MRDEKEERKKQHVHVREMKKEGRKKQATQSHFSKEKCAASGGTSCLL